MPARRISLYGRKQWTYLEPYDRARTYVRQPIRSAVRHSGGLAQGQTEWYGGRSARAFARDKAHHTWLPVGGALICSRRSGSTATAHVLDSTERGAAIFEKHRQDFPVRRRATARLGEGGSAGKAVKLFDYSNSSFWKRRRYTRIASRNRGSSRAIGNP